MGLATQRRLAPRARVHSVVDTCSKGAVLSACAPVHRPHLTAHSSAPHSSALSEICARLMAWLMERRGGAILSALTGVAPAASSGAPPPSSESESRDCDDLRRRSLRL